MGITAILYGNKDDVCAVSGCGTILRGANPYTVCQVHERTYRENKIALTERARRKNSEGSVTPSPVPVPHSSKSTAVPGPASRQLVADAVARFSAGEPFGISEVVKLAGRSDPVCRQVLAELAESGAIAALDDHYPLRYVRTNDDSTRGGGTATTPVSYAGDAGSTPALATSLPDPAPAPAPDEGLTHPAAGSDPVSDDGGQDSGPEPPPLTGVVAEATNSAALGYINTPSFTPFAGVTSSVEKLAPHDPELYALCRCAELLDELGPMARERVIGYLTARSEA